MFCVEEEFRFQDMRFPQSFIIYPTKIGETVVTLQSDKRIAKIDLSTKKGMLSKNHPRGAYFHHLSALLGAYEITLTDEQVSKIMAMQVKMSKYTNKDGSTTIGGSVTYV